jgi:hypothetical protein
MKRIRLNDDGGFAGWFRGLTNIEKAQWQTTRMASRFLAEHSGGFECLVHKCALKLWTKQTIPSVLVGFCPEKITTNDGRERTCWTRVTEDQMWGLMLRMYTSEGVGEKYGIKVAPIMRPVSDLTRQLCVHVAPMFGFVMLGMDPGKTRYLTVLEAEQKLRTRHLEEEEENTPTMAQPDFDNDLPSKRRKLEL